MKTIVITGGPCSGKTSAMDVLREHLAQEHIPAMYVAEAGTDLILAGLGPKELGSMQAFQTRVAALQVEREAQAHAQAQQMEHDTQNEVLIICDRGISDGEAYLPFDEYIKVLEENGLDLATVYDRYDAVFCLESTAKLKSGAYTTANNTARHESPEEAAALDDRTRAAWEAHPHFSFIANEDSFQTKAEKLVEGILAFANLRP